VFVRSAGLKCTESKAEYIKEPEITEAGYLENTQLLVYAL
jgi:hypothetical protein